MEVLTIFSVPSAFTMTATVPGVTFSTGISTLTLPALFGTETDTAGASPVMPAAGTSTGRVTLSPDLAASADTEAVTSVTSPCLSVTTVPVVPSAVFAVVVTVPSFLVSTTVELPSGYLVVSVTVPVVLFVIVVVVDPSGCFSVEVVVLEPVDEPPPEGEPPPEPPDSVFFPSDLVMVYVPPNMTGKVIPASVTATTTVLPSACLTEAYAQSPSKGMVSVILALS